MGALDEVDIAGTAAEHGVPGAAVGLLVDGEIYVHPVITLRGEPTAPATAIVHFGRVLERTMQPNEATNGPAAP